MRNAVIVSLARTPIGKAKKGSLKDTRPEEFASAVVKELLHRTKGLEPEQVEDVIFGCAMPEGEQGMNIARIIGLMSEIPDTVPDDILDDPF